MVTAARKTLVNGIRKEANQFQKATSQLQFSGKVEGVERFNAALKQYLVRTKKTVPQALNDKAMFIARGAVKNTFKADKGKIMSDLDKTSYSSEYLTVAQAIEIKRAADNGETLTPAKLNANVRKLKGARSRAIGFLRTGWFPAIKAFATAISRAASGMTGGKKVGKDKGYGITAKDTTWTPKAVLENQIQAGGRAIPENYMEQGLSAAFNAEAASMEAYLEKKMQADADKFNRSN